MGALDEVSPVESVDNEGVQIVLPTNTLSEIRLELDEGAKGVKGSWIDAKVVDRLGLKKRPCEGQRRFRSRLLPGQTFTPKEEVSITLLHLPHSQERWRYSPSYERLSNTRTRPFMVYSL